jgi:hypothetical protein
MGILAGGSVETFLCCGVESLAYSGSPIRI